jgi:hypothetical protein
LLSNKNVRTEFRKRYMETAALYYKGQPPFDELLARIKDNINKL